MGYNSPIMTPDPGITIRPFRPEDQQQARALVLAGLAEHWGKLDPSKNPDLENIAESYAGVVFLVAEKGGCIIATGALVPRSGGTAEIVRMSVARGIRRQGLGSLILQELIEQAKRLGFRRIVLETTETWAEVIAFYQRLGFVITHYQDGDVYFELELDEGEGEGHESS